MTDRTAAGGPRATGLRSKKEALSFFAGIASAQSIVAMALALVVLRIVVADWSISDAVVLAITVSMIGLFEWIVHLGLLHAPEDSFRMTKLGTGTGHRRHHLDPPDLDWLLLARVDAILFTAMFSVFTAAWTVPLLWLTGGPILGPYVSAYLGATIALLHYEWTHLLVHTAYRPRSRYYQRLARNHRLHHYRNEKYWLGVTSNLGDRVLRTLPKDKAEVPVSDTARTL